MVDTAEAPSPPATDDLGRVVAGYRLDQLIGAGGMGRVYSAVHLKLGRAAAIKILGARFKSDETLVSRFYREARIVNSARHPNIVDMIDFVDLEDPPGVACVMELLQGPSLKQLLKERLLRPEQALHLGVQIADALATVHKLGVVHGDLAPSNIIVVEPRDSDFAKVPSLKLLDFGLGKDHVTPELIAGGDVSAKADVYAFGELLFEMISGKKLYSGIPTDVLETSFDFGRTFTGDERMRTLIARCVAFSPEARPSSEDLLLELRMCQEALIAAREPAPVEAPTPMSQPTHDIRYDPARDPRYEPEPDKPKLPPVDRISAKLYDAPPPRHSGANLPAAAPLALPPSPARRTADLPPTLSRDLPRPRLQRPPKLRRTLLLLALLATTAAFLISEQLREAASRPMQNLARRMLPKNVKREEPPPLEPARDEEYVAQLYAWKKQLGDPKGSAATHLENARIKHLRDTWKDYAAAHELFQRALMLEPKNAIALAGAAENLAAWKGEALSGDERDLAAIMLSVAEHASRGLPAITRARAALALAEGDLERCQKLAAIAVEGDGSDGEARLWLAASYAQGDVERAIVEAESAIAAAPQLRRRDLIVARAEASGGRYRAAMSTLDRRLQSDPKNSAAHRLYGDLERELGRNDRAVARYRQAIAGEGDKSGARLALGALQLATGDHSGAADAFRGVTQDKDAPPHYKARANIGLARALFNLGRHAQAKPPLDLALTAMPHDNAARLVRAELLFADGDAAAADTLALDILSSRPGEPAALLLRARAAAARGAGEDAVKFASEALRSNAQDAEVRAVFAGLYLSFGAKRQAFELMRDAARLDPLERFNDPRRGWFGLPPKVVQDAIARLEQAAQDEGSRADAFASLALVASFRGRTADARSYASRAIAADPSNPLAIVYDVWTALESGATERASAAISKWAKADAYGAMVHLMKARLLRKSRVFGEAATEYDVAHRVDPALYLAPVEKKALDLKSGDFARAREVVNAIKDRPNLTEPRRLLFEAGF